MRRPVAIGSSDQGYDLALRWLAVRGLTRHEIEERLRRRGLGAVEVEAVADRLMALGLLDDVDLATHLVRRWAASGQGPGAIYARLRRRGVAEETIKAVMAAETTREDWLRIAETIRERYDIQDPRARARLMRRLARQGFPAGVVAEVIGHEADERHERSNRNHAPENY